MMTYTPVWGTGLEMGSIELENLVYSGTVALETTTVHTGGYSMRMFGAYKPAAVVTLSFSPIVGNQSEIYLSAWVYANVYLGIYAVTGDGYNVGVYRDGTNWDAYVNSVKVADGSVSIANGEWHLLEMYVKVDNSGAIQTKIDGIADIDYSGDTQPGTSADSYAIRFNLAGDITKQPTAYIDDITIATGGWIGDVRYGAALVPTADTAVKWWEPSTGTDNYALLDELPPSDTDNVSSGSPGSKDLYEMADWTGDPTFEIQFIVDWVRAKKDVAGDQQIRSVIKSGATESSGGSIDLSTTYQYYGRILTTDPDTSAAWEDAGIDALLAGQEYL